ncbi:MAG: site-2 protease family protein [Planctomycetes bacterium]|nr:site-2 protease family protein [Planctomycetota bacterium]
MSIFLSILGIGLLLLIHEGGHYFAARAVGIRVKVFALGFGPRLFGWRRNGTDFRLALLPLGGYVQVAGDDPSRPPRPGDLFYASPLQRLFFYAGGILANFAFAFLVIPILFSIGVPFVSPTVGSIVSNGPAWQAGLLPDDIVLAVNQREVHGFRHISSGVALAERDSELSIKVLRGGVEQRLILHPEFSTQQGFSTIGVGPAFQLSFAADSPILKTLKEFDQVISINGFDLSTAFETQLALSSLASGADTFTITAANNASQTRVYDFDAKDYYSSLPQAPQLGVVALSQQVAVSRGMLAGLVEQGDLIVAANETFISQQSSLLSVLAATSNGELTLSVVTKDGTSKDVSLPAMSIHQLQHDLALTTNDRLSFSVHPQSAAYAAGLRNGCSIIRANNVAIQKMSDLRQAIADAKGQSISLNVIANIGAESTVIEVTPAPIKQLDLGLMLAGTPTKVIARNPLHAISLGYREAKAMVGEVTTTAKRLFTGEVASKNMGGIISIGVMTNTFANQGLVSLLFFLCLISVNLAVLNFLPIPALDGGHILFALYEIVTRRQVSVSVQNVFQLVGVVLVLSMLVFVTSNDIQRLLS